MHCMYVCLLLAGDLNSYTLLWFTDEYPPVHLCLSLQLSSNSSISWHKWPHFSSLDWSVPYETIIPTSCDWARGQGSVLSCTLFGRLCWRHEADGGVHEKVYEEIIWQLRSDLPHVKGLTRYTNERERTADFFRTLHGNISYVIVCHYLYWYDCFLLLVCVLH